MRRTCMWKQRLLESTRQLYGANHRDCPCKGDIDCCLIHEENICHLNFGFKVESVFWKKCSSIDGI